MSKLFEKNLEKWSATDPRRALLLPYLELKKSWPTRAALMHG